MKLSKSLANMAQCQCNTGLRALARKTAQLEEVVEQLETAARGALETLTRLRPACDAGFRAADLQTALDALYDLAEQEQG